MKPPPPSRFDKPKPPVVGHEQVTCSCGHTASFELFADRQDRFRAGRRKKFTSRPCPNCRQKANEERAAREQAASAERKAQKQAAAAEREKAAPPGPGGTGHQADRLPHGAAFAVSYDAQALRWRGTLTIPGAEAGREQVFEGEASGVFRLLTDLDRRYRDGAAAEDGQGGKTV